MMPLFDFLGFLAILSIFALSRMWQATNLNGTFSYIFAVRHTRLFGLIATLVTTELNTATLLSFSSAGYFAGDWAITLPFIFLIGLSFYALTVAKKYREISALNIVDVFHKKYGLTYARLVSPCLIIAMIGISSTYVRSLTIFFAPLLRLDHWILSSILVITILFFTIGSGLNAIMRSDIINFLLALFFLPLIFYWTVNFSESDPVEPLSFATGRDLLPPNFIISLMIISSLSYLVAPWYGQKILSAKNAKIAYWALAIASVFIFVLYGLVVLACSVLQKKGIELKSAENALPFILANVVPTGARGIVFGLFFCIGATTLAGLWNAIVSIAMSNLFFWSHAIKRQAIFITIFIALSNVILSNTLVDIVFNKLILAHITLFALSFALIAAFYWPRVTTFGAYASTIIGLIWGFFCYLYFGTEENYTIYWAFFGLPLIVTSGILGSLLERARPRWAAQRRSVD